MAQLEDVMTRVLQVWVCDNCPVKVRYTVGFQDQKLNMVCLSVPLNNNKYSIQFIYPKKICRITEILHADFDRMTQEVVLELPEIPDINPQNAIKKLSTILTFL